ncbi:aminopeptidase P family N-terminal domain-containing protein [bacterium]|nr:aminopeptidase P family N-terminal domain-containing protein [bacterium]
METIQPTLKRGRDVWNQINMPLKEFHKRIDQVREEMKKEDMDLLLLYGNGANNYGNPCYLTNFVTKMARGALVVLPSKGDPTLIVQGFPRDEPAVKNTTWIEDIRSCSNIPLECIEYLKEKNLMSSTIGLAGLKQYMPYDQFRLLSGSLEQCKIIDANPIISKLRMTKSEREQDHVRRSSRIISRAFEFLCNGPLPRLDEIILDANLDYGARIDGAEDIRILLAKPLETEWAFRTAGDVAISDGDRIIIYLAVAFERYWAEGIRTFEVRSSSLIDQTSDDAGALYERILNMIIPGKALSQFYGEATGEIGKSPMDELGEYGLGQGIGLSLHESPVIDQNATGHFEEGMCFALHVMSKDKEIGPCITGETILLSKEKAEVLTV